MAGLRRGPSRRLALAVVAAVAIGSSAGAAAASRPPRGTLTGSYTTILYPKSKQTDVRYIGPGGAIAGQYQALNGSWHGFTRIHGVWRSISYPKGKRTFVSDIGPKGELLGGYIDSHGVGHGFIDKAGVFTSLTAPGADGTNVSSGNSVGNLAGTVQSPTGESGFVYTAGKFATFMDPNPGGVPGLTQATGIDDAGLVVGWAAFTGRAPESAFEEHAGLYTGINDHEQPAGGYTRPAGIGPTGEIVGVWGPATAPQTGAYVQIGTKFSDLPAGPGGSLSIDPQYANKLGDVVGFYYASASVEKGFEFVPS